MPDTCTVYRERQSETTGPRCREPGHPEEEGIDSDQGISKGTSEEVAFELGEEGKGTPQGTEESKAQRHETPGAVWVTVKCDDWFSMVGSGQRFSIHYLISLKLFAK